jgi:arylformamidase
MRRPGLLAALLGLRGPGQGGDGEALALPAGVLAEHDRPYGPHAIQRLDIYHAPAQAPRGLILLVHGGGWQRGDKGMARLVQHKLAHWVPRGWVVASVDYRLQPEADPLVQAGDVALALAHLQQHAAVWRRDPARCVLMGHSAGAHLVALLAADATLATAQGASPWRATVAIDSGAYDVPALMQGRHLPLFDQAFGDDPAQWRVASPLHRLSTAPAAPVLLVCSGRRAESGASARAFAERVMALGGQAELLAVDWGHLQINEQLGLDPAYTAAVDAFLDAL